MTPTAIATSRLESPCALRSVPMRLNMAAFNRNAKTGANPIASDLIGIPACAMRHRTRK
ncbi:hypothetical protein [Sphingomonas sp. GC_Shp_2]|uniref:hypothetical protein n=1 Tax=Sphingomonas sp. GC_Shp_2 TaxID=2937384 RepID=UPI00226AA2FC|nr:hypothetical protein [Sphingomonas sp. GC_Shp_2]